MAFYRFSINGVLWAWPNYKLVLLVLSRHTCTKLHYNISTFSQVTAASDRHTDGRTDSYPSFNTSRQPDHLYTYIYNSISCSISFR